MLKSLSVTQRCSRHIPILRESLRLAHTANNVASGSQVPSLPPTAKTSRTYRVPHKNNSASGTWHKKSSNNNDTSYTPSHAKTHRHSPPKHKYNNTLSNEKALRPAVQSSRVQELMQRGDYDGASALLSEAKITTLNAIVFNNVLHGLMKQEKRKEAYRLYVDMKRRGIKPTINTYLALLLGMSTVEDWAQNSVNLERSHSIFAEYKVRRQEMIDKNFERDSRTGINDPLIFYIRILGNAGLYQKLFDVFYSLEDNGVGSPDARVYSAFFYALKARKSVDESNDLRVGEQNASDAKLIWKRLEKDVERGTLKVDSVILAQVINLLAQGRQSDHQLALEIIRKYCGLVEPGKDALPQIVKVDNVLSSEILMFCNKTGRFRLCLNFIQQLQEQYKKEGICMTHYQTNEVLVALSGLAALSPLDESKRAVEALKTLTNENIIRYQNSGIHPKTYGLALAVCWRCKDWESACQIFDIATGIRIEDFSDTGKVANGATCEKAPEKIPWALYTMSWAHLARIALATKDKKIMRQFFRAAHYVGIKSESSSMQEKHKISNIRYYKRELAMAIVEMWGLIKHGSKEHNSWHDSLVMQSFEYLNKNKVWGRHMAKPDEELSVLGSDEYLSKVSRSIDDEMYSRRNV